MELMSQNEFLSQKATPQVQANSDMALTRQKVEEFEAFFISQTFETMYNTVPVNETFGGGNAEKIFRSMMIDEYGKMATKAGGIGVSDQIMSQLLAQQEVSASSVQEIQN